MASTTAVEATHEVARKPNITASLWLGCQRLRVRSVQVQDVAVKGIGGPV
jgi:hypothetical protein